MLKFNTFDELPGEPEEYKKRTTIQAVQIDQPFQVVTLEGEVEGKGGDWLAKGVGGELYPIADQIFLDSYSPVDEEKSHNCAVCNKPTPSQNSRHEAEIGVYFPDLDFITITEDDASSCHTCYTEVKETKKHRDAEVSEEEVEETPGPIHQVNVVVCPDCKHPIDMHGKGGCQVGGPNWSCMCTEKGEADEDTLWMLGWWERKIIGREDVGHNGATMEPDEQDEVEQEEN